MLRVTLAGGSSLLGRYFFLSTVLDRLIVLLSLAHDSVSLALPNQKSNRVGGGDVIKSIFLA